MPQVLETFQVAFQAEEPHRFSDRYEGFLTMVSDGRWTVEIYDANSEDFSYPVLFSPDPFEVMEAAKRWAGSAE